LVLSFSALSALAYDEKISLESFSEAPIVSTVR
jgi:hypothetical protein